MLGDGRIVGDSLIAGTRLTCLSPQQTVKCAQKLSRGRTAMSTTVSINRAPLLTLWAAVVAQHLGFDEDEALSLGKAVAGLNAQAKGRRLGLFKPHEEKARKAREKERGERFWIEVLSRP